jgi:hypothetical protein
MPIAVRRASGFLGKPPASSRSASASPAVEQRTRARGELQRIAVGAAEHEEPLDHHEQADEAHDDQGDRDDAGHEAHACPDLEQ